MAPPFQLDARVTKHIAVLCEDMLATVLKTEHIIAESRELLARIDAALANDLLLPNQIKKPTALAA